MFRAYHQGIPSRIPSITISFTFLKGCIVYTCILKSSQRLYIWLIKCGRFVSCSFYLIMPYYFPTMSIWRDYIICSKFLWERWLVLLGILLLFGVSDFFLFVCVCTSTCVRACICACVPCVCRCPWRLEECVGSLGPGGTGSCEGPDLGIMKWKPSSPPGE